MKPWKYRINEAIKIGEFSTDDKEDSDDWTKCAVAEKFQAENPNINFSEIEIREHMDQVTYDLGSDFCDAVQCDYIGLAQAIYEKIQKCKIPKVS